MDNLIQPDNFILTAEQWLGLRPILVLAVGTLLTMIISLIRVDTKRPAQIATILTLVAATYSIWQGSSLPVMELFNHSVEASPLTRTGLTLMLIASLGLILGSSRYLTKEKIHISDFYHLVLMAVLGAAVLISARSLIVLFVALETMSLPIYTLVGFRRNDPRSNEAAVKYFVLGGVAGAVFLLGAAFLFGATGSLHFSEIAKVGATAQPAVFWLGWMLIVFSFLFKVAAVPFQVWKPDVYEGAPVPVTGLMSTLVTTASFIALAKVVHMGQFSENQSALASQALEIMAILSMFLGSVVMITQTNLKRFFAYSAISNTGYMLLALAASIRNPESISSLWIFLASYSAMLVGVFLLMSMGTDQADQGLDLVDLTGLQKRNPAIASLWSVFLFSMAGLPLTFGFVGKFSVFRDYLMTGSPWIMVFAVICSVISAYGYLRIVALMIMREADVNASKWKCSAASLLTTAIFAIVVIGLGVYPKHVLELLKRISLLG